MWSGQESEPHMHRQFWQPCTQLLHQSGSESAKHKERERERGKKKREKIAYMGDDNSTNLIWSG
jgi:hypothetical protein